MGENNDFYKERWLKTKLKIKYREHVTFIEASGKPNVARFKKMTEFIVNKWFSERKKTQKTRLRTKKTCYTIHQGYFSFGGKNGETLASLRYAKLRQMSSCDMCCSRT